MSYSASYLASALSLALSLTLSLTLSPSYLASAEEKPASIAEMFARLHSCAE